jgi:hypothetical protein
MVYKDKYGQPVDVWEIYDSKGKLVTVTASEEAAELYVLGYQSKYFKPWCMAPKEYPGHPDLKLKKVKA